MRLVTASSVGARESEKTFSKHTRLVYAADEE
jgi:hypothetical protein